MRLCSPHTWRFFQLDCVMLAIGCIMIAIPIWCAARNLAAMKAWLTCVIIIAADAASGGNIPDAHSAIIAARHDQAAIWAELTGAYPVAVACQAEQESLRW